MRTCLLFLGVLVTMTGAAKLPSQTSGPTLKRVAEFDLPGPPGKRFDYLTIDPDDDYLISAHLAAKQTYVIDLATNKVVATVTDTPGADGVEYVPDLHKFYTSNAYDNHRRGGPEADESHQEIENRSETGWQYVRASVSQALCLGRMRQS